MALHGFLFLLVFFPFLLLLLWRFAWLHLQPSGVKAGPVHTPLHRLLKPRSPDDCPTCRLSCTNSSGVGPAPVPVRPWCEVKSRRGAPKHINTEGLACPNHLCPYFGNTDVELPLFRGGRGQ